jgi:hypothetical protein
MHRLLESCQEGTEMQISDFESLKMSGMRIEGLKKILGS